MSSDRIRLSSCDPSCPGAVGSVSQQVSQVSPEDWLQRRAQQLGEALRHEMCADIVERPWPRPDPRFQFPRGYSYAAMRVPPHGIEAARRAAAASGGARVHGDTRGLGLSITGLKGDKNVS